MVVVHIDNVIIAEVDTTSSLQTIKIVYGGLFVTKISCIKMSNNSLFLTTAILGNRLHTFGT